MAVIDLDMALGSEISCEDGERMAPAYRRGPWWCSSASPSPAPTSGCPVTVSIVPIATFLLKFPSYIQKTLQHLSLNKVLGKDSGIFMFFQTSNIELLKHDLHKALQTLLEKHYNTWSDPWLLWSNRYSQRRVMPNIHDSTGTPIIRGSWIYITGILSESDGDLAFLHEIVSSDTIKNVNYVCISF